MKAFTPLLPGSMPEPDDLGKSAIRQRHEPPPPPGPNPHLPNVARESISFREALYSLLQAHEAEIEALQEEVEKLRGKHNGEANQLQQISARPDADNDQTQVVQFDDKQFPKYEAFALGMPRQVPDKKKNCQSSEATAQVKFVEFEEKLVEEFEDDRKTSLVTITNSGKMSQATIANRDTFLTTANRDTLSQDYIPRRSTLRSSLATIATVSMTMDTECSRNFAHLGMIERKWIKLVSDRYMLANQHTNQLHDRWVMSDSHLKKICQNNDNVDIWPSIEANRKKVRRGQQARFSNFNVSFGSAFGSGSGSVKLLNAIKNLRGNMIKNMVNGRVDYIRQYGCVAFLEKYYVILPHSAMHLFWVALGMALISYDAVIVPLQPFDLDESRGALAFFKWFQVVYWSMDILVTFFTAIYVDVELVRKLSVIASKYATSWLLFDLCILLPVWVEQLSVNGSGFADVKALKAIRMLRFFRLVRLAKFTFLLDEQLKAVNNPSLILIFKLLRLVLGLIIFTHVNGCMWYGVGKQHNGWTVELGDTDDLYKYLTAVHWTITQFSGTSEMAPGKFSAERAYAVFTVLMSILIFAIFLSNFTNIIMQLQALTVERDHQLRDLCIYMRGHQIPRQLSMKVRNYLNWKSNTDKCRGCEALQILPERLVMEIEFEVCSPTIAQHEFFCEFLQVYPRLSRRVFHGLTAIYMSPEDLVFSAQESTNFVYFTVSGVLDYAVILRRANEALTLSRETVTTGVTLSEPTLWMQWQHRGTLMSLTYCHLLALNAEQFNTMIITHPPAHVSCNLYARRLIAGMAKDYWRCTDVIIPAQLITEDHTNFLDNILEFSMQKLISAGNNLATRVALVQEQEAAENDDD